jgi:cell wall-associated NlpC family hydrolase
MNTARECIDKYLGIPYVHLGRTMAGLDCYGLIILVYKDLGFDLIDIVDYEKKWAAKGNDLIIENYQKQWVRVEEPKLFDTVVFRGMKGIAQHAGIFLGNDKFLHCVDGPGVVVGNLNVNLYNQRIEGYFRIKQ